MGEGGGGSNELPKSSRSHPGSSIPASFPLPHTKIYALRQSQSKAWEGEGWEGRNTPMAAGNTPMAAGSSPRATDPVLSTGGCRSWDGGASQDVLLDCLFSAFLSSSLLALHRISQVLLSCTFRLCNSKKMNPKVPFEPVGIPAPLGRGEACITLGLLFLILRSWPHSAFFPPCFFLLTPLQSLALEVYYCLCRSVPGHPHWQMLDLKSMDEKLSRHIRARGGGVFFAKGVCLYPPSSARPPSPTLPRKTFHLEIN